MEEVIHNLRYGVATPFKHNPEPLWAPPSHTQTDQAAAAGFTDNLCSWLKQGFVAGPFKEPPIEGLRINTVFSVEQPDKYRNIMNMSFPKKRSYNDAIDEDQLHSVKMTNPRLVSQAVRKAGKGAVMSKLDMKDAYKLLSIQHGDLKYQGFMWMGMIFIEKRLIFGSKPAVPAFDIFHASIVNLVRAEARTNPKFEHRILDDMLFISPGQGCILLCDLWLKSLRHMF